jgi:hypothetical protein
MQTKRNIALAGFGVVLGAVLILTQAGWSGVGSSKLEGAWIAKVPPEVAPLQWSYTLVPDPSGKRPAMYGSIQVHIPPAIVPPYPFPELEYNSDMVGELVMTGRNTGKFTAVWYGMKRDFPFNQIVYIGVGSGQVRFTGPGKAETINALAFYAPETDGDGDGLPDPGEAPTLCLSAQSQDTRVPMLPPACTP